ncbi:MAG: S41 family peptidase [Anaerolineae bacterium]|nr:S41 family peptidase [Candidatus Roseilinea sp.]MDW8450218.1 S41 family peptidase [Anaerolineae bacterium]
MKTRPRFASCCASAGLVVALTLTGLGVALPSFASGPAALQVAAPSAQSLRTTPTPTPGIAAGTMARQRRIFRKLWNIVNERYIYPDFNGFDWQAARVEINRRINAGMTDEAFYEVMRDLIASLDDDHSQFLSPDEAREEDAEYEGIATYTGIGIVSAVNAERGYIYVLAVMPDSPAEQAGIRPHDHVLEIDGQPSVDASGESQSWLLRGEAGTTVMLRVRTPGQEPRLVEVQRGEVTSVERIEHRLLSSGALRIGYLNVPSLFEADVLSRSRAAIRDLMKDGPLDGFILDLRINGGGTYGNLRGLLAIFTSGDVGEFVSRSGTTTPIRVRASGIGNSQEVPLVVLIGAETESFAEVLAGVLQAAGRATLVGQRTAGNIEILLSHDFEDGSRLWLAEETFRLLNGAIWEGEGLTPNVLIPLGWDEYTAEDDPVLAAALRQFESR